MQYKLKETVFQKTRGIRNRVLIQLKKPYMFLMVLVIMNFLFAIMLSFFPLLYESYNFCIAISSGILTSAVVTMVITADERLRYKKYFFRAILRNLEYFSRIDSLDSMSEIFRTIFENQQQLEKIFEEFKKIELISGVYLTDKEYKMVEKIEVSIEVLISDHEKELYVGYEPIFEEILDFYDVNCANYMQINRIIEDEIVNKYSIDRYNAYLIIAYIMRFNTAINNIVEVLSIMKRSCLGEPYYVREK